MVAAEASTPAALRERLVLASAFAISRSASSACPTTAATAATADLGRTAAVWNVVAAPELSLTLETWCFPVVGCVGYRGYFDRADADAEGRDPARARASRPRSTACRRTRRWASSTGLGGDPLLNTFVS